jgi:hypothetical protein
MDIAKSSLVINGAPRPNAPEMIGNRWVFQSLGFELQGSTTIVDKGDKAIAKPVVPARANPAGVGWRIGWIQVSKQDWSWALYRSTTGNDATLLEWPGYTAMDRKDRANPGDLFTTLADGSYQILEGSRPGQIVFKDKPHDDYAPNLAGATGNHVLSAVGLRLSFVCALAARAPDDALYVLQWVPWYVQWSYDVVQGKTPTALTGCRAAAGPVSPGPTPRILIDALAGANGPSANELAQRAPQSVSLKGPMIDVQLRRLRARG